MTVTARRPTAIQTDSRSHPDRWPLTRVLVFLLANAFAGLAMEIRVEHVDAVHEQGVAWTNPTMNHSDGPPQMAPLAFGGLGMIGILTSLRRFNP
jgi:hypothetical protein